jgi:hypothetical protein
MLSGGSGLGKSYAVEIILKVQAERRGKASSDLWHIKSAGQNDNWDESFTPSQEVIIVEE